ncbi:hypothetical protein CKAH01_01117 [Colletotrichum kahawae]|uniref:Uncharacterized protein n=1 Tax=Colletotrichum kahawae TaxID=34407 RepID=A0AAD9YC93_COLKA|nr:hypothetical protein CKAH01_01117 [Colletotrichum kahawae]
MSPDLLSQMLSVPSQVWGSDPSVSSGRRKYASRTHVGKRPDTTSEGPLSESARPSEESGSMARQLSARVQNPIKQIRSTVDRAPQKRREGEEKERKVNQGIRRTSVLVGCLLDASFLPPSTTPSW